MTSHNIKRDKFLDQFQKENMAQVTFKNEKPYQSNIGVYGRSNSQQNHGAEPTHNPERHNPILDRWGSRKLKLSLVSVHRPKFGHDRKKSSFRKRYRRFVRVKVRPTADEFCLLSVKKTKNNTHCSLSRLFGDRKTLWTMSGGKTPAAGSRSNGRRKSRYCQRMIFKAATEKLLGLGFKYLVIHCIGRAISKRYIFRNFYRRFRIVLLKDLLAIAHNGCRPKSVRRL